MVKSINSSINSTLENYNFQDYEVNEKSYIKQRKNKNNNNDSDTNQSDSENEYEFDNNINSNTNKIIRKNSKIKFEAKNRKISIDKSNKKSENEKNYRTSSSTRWIILFSSTFACVNFLFLIKKIKL